MPELNISKLSVPFINGSVPSIEERKNRIISLRQMLTDHEDDFIKALQADLNKSRYECLFLEILPVKHEIGIVLAGMDEWCSEKKLPRTFMSLLDTASIQPQPYGLVLVLGAWNYPIVLCLKPVIGALAAGNAVVLKPSEIASATEKLFAELIPQYLDESVCQVFTGGVDGTKELLDKQKFDYVFYTGGAGAAKSILAQIAKNLTPVTLELGGKSPVYVDTSADIKLTAKRVMWSKNVCSGQTCVAPDYILCRPEVQDELIKECIKVIEEFHPKDMAKSEAYSRVINERHTERLINLLNKTTGKIAHGGGSDLTDKFIELTLVKDVPKDDILMEDEIFGPILPIVTVNSVDEAIAFVNSKEKPLALYVYATNQSVHNEFKARTSSGSLVFNECMFQLAVPNLPFGGVGNSGMGRYSGEASIKTFSHPRSILDKSLNEKANNLLRYPPYTESHESWARWAFSTRDHRSRCFFL